MAENPPVNHDALVLNKLLQLVANGPEGFAEQFVDKFERAKALVEIDLLKAENARLQKASGESPLKAVGGKREKA